MNNLLNPFIRNTERPAFLIGNGINIYTKLLPDWKQLLSEIGGSDLESIEGLSNTEIYDLIELKNPFRFEKRKDLKVSVTKKLLRIDLSRIKVHRKLMTFAKDNDIPVLTTNFDFALPESIQCKLMRTSSEGFTDFYPWKSYYGFDQHDLATDGFGIWHIHGSLKYIRSIRLGLTDYMGCVHRARSLIHKGPGRLYDGKNQENWKGRQTWLHIWFNMPLIIIGLGYSTNEVFLRWLLIERKGYFNKFGKEMNVWYISKGPPHASVSNLLKNLEVEIVEVNEYSEIYD